MKPILLALLACMCEMAMSEEPTGFKDLKLGAPYSAIAAGRDGYMTCNNPSGGVDRFCLIDVYPSASPDLSQPRDQLTTVGAVRVDVGLTFRAQRLSAITLMFATEHYETMLAGIVDKYGKVQASGADQRTNGAVTITSRWATWLTHDAFLRIDEQRNKIGRATFSIMSKAVLEDAKRKLPSAKDF